MTTVRTREEIEQASQQGPVDLGWLVRNIPCKLTVGDSFTIYSARSVWEAIRGNCLEFVRIDEQSRHGVQLQVRITQKGCDWLEQVSIVEPETIFHRRPKQLVPA